MNTFTSALRVMRSFGRRDRSERLRAMRQHVESEPAGEIAPWVALSPGEFESFFLDRAALTAKTPRGHEDFQRLYMEIIQKHSKWLQPAEIK